MSSSASRRTALALVVFAGCADSFTQRANAGLQAALTATAATQSITVATCDAAEKRVLEKTQLAVTALPDGPERPKDVERIKGDARVRLVGIRNKCDKTFAAVGEAYEALALAAMLLPMATTTETRAEVTAEFTKAAKALGSAR